LIVGQPRDVSTRPGKALHEPDADGIGRAIHDDGNRRRRSFGSGGPWPPACHDQVRLEPNQLGSQIREALVLCLRVTPLKDEVLTFDPPALPELSTKG